MAKLKDRRVLLLSGWYYPDSVGGTEKYVRLLGKELKAKGLNVTVAAPSNDEKEHTYIYDGLPVYRYPVSLKPARGEVRGEVPPEYFEIFANRINKEKPDIVHLHSFTRGCGFFHARYIKQLGIPMVFTVHVPGLTCVRGTMLRWGRIPCDGKMRISRCGSCYLQKRGLLKWAGFLRMKKLIMDRKERIQRLLNMADHIVGVSQWLYDVLRLNGVSDSKLSLCRHGLPGEPIKTERSSKTETLTRVGYIGRFNPVKGVHILIEAIKKLPFSMPIELCLYGRTNDDEEKFYLKRLKRITGKDSRIRFFSEITDKNRQEIFGNLDIVAVPSLWFETGPLVVLEAFAAGVPVIGSDLGGIAELVTNRVDGLLVEAGSIKAWRDGLEEVSLDRRLLDGLSKGISPVRSTKEVVEEMLALYRHIVNSKENFNEIPVGGCRLR